MDVIVENDEIRDILAYFLFSGRASVHIYNEKGQLLGSGAARDGGKFAVVRCDDLRRVEGEQVLHFMFAGYIAYYTFKERIVGAGDGDVTILKPLVLIKKRKRCCPRIDGRGLEVYLQGPQGGKYEEGRAVNVSFGGIAVELDRPGGSLQAGTHLDRIVVRIPGCGEVQASGIVKHVSEASRAGLVRFGIAFTSFFRSCRDVWKRYVFNLLLPSLEGEGFDFGAEDFFSELDAAGYLTLCGRSVDFYQPVKHSFYDFYDASGSIRSERNFLHHFGDRLMGAASKNRLYAHTFILHHFGVERGVKSFPMSKEGIAKQIMIAMLIDSYLTEDLHYCAIYISANKKWNRIYKDFVSGISDRSMYNFNFYNFLEFDLNSFSEAGSFLGHTDVKAAGRGVLPAVSEFLKRSVPPLLYEAYDYSPELIDFSEYNRITGGIFSRERRFFYCQRFGEIHGVAVAESSSHTINLFNLGDSVRVIVRGDLPDEEKTRIKRSLLKKVACYFASRCRPYFVYYCYDRDCSYAESLGFRKLERSCEFVLKKELIPSFMDFIETRLSIIEYMKANGK